MMLYSRKWMVTPLVLAAATAVALGLLLVDIVLTWRTQYVFLVFNLFLAGLPVVFAYGVQKFLDYELWWLSVPFFIGWFLFFPNAHYLLTDLAYLFRFAPWFDSEMIGLPGAVFYPSFHIHVIFEVVELGAFAVAGVLFGVFSLRIMVQNIMKIWTSAAGWWFAVVMAFLTGFGIFVGRILRWHSWHVFTKNFRLVGDFVTRIQEAEVFWGLVLWGGGFSLIVLVTYWLFVSFCEASWGDL